MPELMAKPELSFSSFPFAGNVYRVRPLSPKSFNLIPIFQELLKYIPDDNFGYSPIALATLLGLARSGCREETAHEIKSGLNFPTNPKEIETVSREIYSQLKKGKNFHCYVANRIYIEQSFPLKMDFKNFSEEVYQIEIEHINFKKLDECRLQINDYVKNATQGQVEDFIDVQEIDPLAKCIIASGVYFKMNWFKFIQKESVSKQKFITISGKSIEVEFMEKTGLYNYFESSELKSTFLEIPIENGFDLVIVLPDDKKGLLRLETRANDVFSLPNYSQTRVKVSVPKFSFSFKFDYRRVLQHVIQHFFFKAFKTLF